MRNTQRGPRVVPLKGVRFSVPTNDDRSWSGTGFRYDGRDNGREGWGPPFGPIEGHKVFFQISSQ
jgi:hypothetical protein